MTISSPTVTITDTPGAGTPTPTPSPTIVIQSLYVYSTMPADGQTVALVYTFTAGEVAIAAINLVMVILLMFIVFLLLVRRPR